MKAYFRFTISSLCIFCLYSSSLFAQEISPPTYICDCCPENPCINGTKWYNTSASVGIVDWTLLTSSGSNAGLEVFVNNNNDVAAIKNIPFVTYGG
ncbi:MAG: hypothetical protein H0W62_08170 [Chitinophagales bacterium]|nr:hypothetical protein [Chitinophagales bacterium]